MLVCTPQKAGSRPAGRLGVPLRLCWWAEIVSFLLHRHGAIPALLCLCDVYTRQGLVLVPAI